MSIAHPVHTEPMRMKPAPYVGYSGTFACRYAAQVGRVGCMHTGSKCVDVGTPGQQHLASYAVRWKFWEAM